MYHIFLLYLVLTLAITSEAQTCTFDFDCSSSFYCPVYPPGTSPPLTRTCRSPQSSGISSYCNKNPFISSPNTNPQCRGWCDLQTNTCKDGADIGGTCIPTIPRTCSRGYCPSNSGIATCQRSLNNGEPCTENIQCSSTYCVNNGGAARTCQTNPANDAIKNAATAFAIGYIIAIIISSICAISIFIGICICICRASRRPIIMNNNAQPKLMVTSVAYPQQQQQQQQQPTSMPLQPIYTTSQQQPYAPQQQQQQQQQQQPYGTPQPIQGQPMMYAHTSQQQPMYLPQGQQTVYAPGMYPQGQAMPMYGSAPQQPLQMYAPNQPIAYGGSQAYVAPPAYAPDAFPEINKPDVEARPVSSSPSGYQPLVESSNTTSQQ